MAFDRKKYLNSLTRKQVMQIFIGVSVLYILFSVFQPFLDCWLVDDFFRHFPRTNLFNAILISFAAGAIIDILVHLHNRLLPTPASLLLCLILVVMYCYIIRLSGHYLFYSFDNWALARLKYADVCLFIVAAVLLEFRSFQKSLSKSSLRSLHADESDLEKNVDLIANESYVNKIDATINETACEFSFAVGIFATWGSGKTDFLRRLKKTLLKNKKENVVIEFNAWKASTPENVITDFFTAMSNALKPYNKSAATKLRSYSNKIFSSGKEIQYRLLHALIDTVVPEKSISETYEEINQSIQSTGKRFIVIIDDLDRMAGTEVIQVLRLIRNSANFTNTFFLVALDHEYVVDVLSKTNLLSREDEYLKKMFQLVITLPKIRKETFEGEVVRLLGIDGLPPEHALQITDAIRSLQFDASQVFGSQEPKGETYFERMFDNYRDVKKFCNSFKINFDILKNEVDVEDLMMLELIKVKCFRIYEALADKTILTFTKGDESKYSLETQELQSLMKQITTDEFYKNSLKAILNRLLDHSKNSPRQFIFPNNFYLYFCFQLFNLISLEDFRITVAKSWKEIYADFEEWRKQNKSKDLERILDNVTDFANADELNKFIQVYLADDHNNNFINRARLLLTDSQKNIPKYFNGDNKKYLEFARQVFNDDELSGFARAKVASELLVNIIDTGAIQLFQKNELQSIIYRLFDIFLAAHVGYDDMVWNFHVFNREGKDEQSHIILTEQSNNRIRSYLKIDKNLEEYVRLAIRSYSLPNTGTFTLEPFGRQIFGNWNTFTEQLRNVNYEDPTMRRVKQIIMDNAAELDKGNAYFPLDGNDKTFVLDYLRSTGQYNF